MQERIGMDNIIIKKQYQDNDLIELRVTAQSEIICVYQSCYVQDSAIINNANRIIAFSSNYEEDVYLEFGVKTGNYTPAFSMLIMKADSFGYLKIEMDMEIDDNDIRSHRCKFYINSELGLVERFGYKLKALTTTSEEGTEISLIQ